LIRQAKTYTIQLSKNRLSFQTSHGR